MAGKNLNKSLIIVGIIVLVILIAGSLYLYSHPSSNNVSSTSNYNSGPISDQGQAVFTITDAAANMNSISGVYITVNTVEAHSESGGWVTVSAVPQTYNLLQLKNRGNEVLLADAQLSTGTYDQVKLEISKVMVMDTSGKSYTAKLPSGELKIAGGFDVSVNTTAAVSFDFITDQSLHVTGDGQYIFAPVVQFDSLNNATANVAADNSVNIHGGSKRDSLKVGTDADGNVGIGLSIPDNESISIDSNGKIQLSVNAKATGNLGVNSNNSMSGIVGGIGYSSSSSGGY